MNESKKRSTFLTVLIIIGFVGALGYIAYSSVLIVSGTAAKNTVFSSEESLEEAKDQIRKEAVKNVNSEEEKLIAEEVVKFQFAALMATRYWRSAGLIILFAQIFTILGLFKMLKLNKEGFALFAIGVMSVPISQAVFFGGIVGILMAIGPIIMVVLFATRLKEMKMSGLKLAQ